MAITQIKGSNIEDGTVLAVDIKDDSITNAKIKSDAAIAQSKLEDLTLTTDVTGTLPVANGGTGATTHTANGVLIGEGTSAMTTVAPSTSGNVLTSDGTDWTSATPAAGGDKRNFIIDGDFTQWPEGTTSTSVVNGDYVPALWKVYRTGGEIVLDAKQSTDVPTVAESGYQSKYSFHIDVTTAETAVGAGDTAYISHMIDGPDYSALHGQDFVLSFWHKHTKTGTFSGSLKNRSAAGPADRNYTFEYTQSVSDTWEKASIAITGDTTGTWQLTEGSLGMTVSLAMMCGSNLAIPAGTWTSTADKVASPNQVAGLDSASNNCKFAQVQLTLGSTAPTFSSPPVATVQSQVDYYVENISGYIGSGWANTSNAGMGVCHWATKRKAPTVTYKDQTLFYIETSTSGGYATTMGMYNPLNRTGRWSWAKTGASHTTGSGAVVRADGTGRMLVDARY